jgi:hypothetical protein
VGESRWLDVNANGLVTRFEQRTHEGLAQMSRTPGDEDGHTVAIFSHRQFKHQPRAHLHVRIAVSGDLSGSAAATNK